MIKEIDKFLNSHCGLACKPLSPFEVFNEGGDEV